ncbi:MAG: GNAT family N-acetyltransferase [Planctomycetes bacterium]|nr:GNAT family N-acetyltransferase [Planctomycetota bacterium]
MIEYRAFRNTDPPRILALWHACRLGRGAVSGVPNDAFETLNYAQPYFDPAGLIVACDDAEVVGMVHAGSAVNEEQSGLDRSCGVICAVLVHPRHRLQGIGRELVRRAAAYLEDAGARQVYAGPAGPRSPFYFGLYGGSQPAGFLESDPAAAGFFRALDYVPIERHAVLQRSISEPRDPVSPRLVELRRRTQLAIAHQRQRVSWWWITRYGRLDSVRFQLITKSQSEPLAGVTVLGLDLYLPKWQERAIGLSDLYVSKENRRQGYGQALVIEVCRRMREELVTRVESHAPEANAAMLGLLRSAGFERVDTGIVYCRSGDATGEHVLLAADESLENQDADETVVLDGG